MGTGMLTSPGGPRQQGGAHGKDSAETWLGALIPGLCDLRQAS